MEVSRFVRARDPGYVGIDVRRRDLGPDEGRSRGAGDCALERGSGITYVWASAIAATASSNAVNKTQEYRCFAVMGPPVTIVSRRVAPPRPTW